MTTKTLLNMIIVKLFTTEIQPIYSHSNSFCLKMLVFSERIHRNRKLLCGFVIYVTKTNKTKYNSKHM